MAARKRINMGPLQQRMHRIALAIVGDLELRIKKAIAQQVKRQRDGLVACPDLSTAIKVLRDKAEGQRVEARKISQMPRFEDNRQPLGTVGSLFGSQLKAFRKTLVA